MMQFVCRTDELEDPGTIAVTLGAAKDAIELMVVRSEGEISVYLNRCPHTGALLDWVPGNFFSLNKKHIQCAVHDALFEIDTGHCVHGPCAGEYLQVVEIKVNNGEIRVDKAQLKQLWLR